MGKGDECPCAASPPHLTPRSNLTVPHISPPQQMSASEDVIHVYKKVSDAKLVIPSGMAESGDVVIEVAQRKSSSNVFL